MNTYTIELKLSPEGINSAIRELRNYQKRVKTKAEELRERVAILIASEASLIFNTAVADDLIGEGFVTGNVEVSVESRDEKTTLVIASGQDTVFMEFGAGVYNNGAVGTSPNPLGSNLGFTIGSYSKSHPEKEAWGYRGTDGEIHVTHGTPASMPLYNAIQNVSRDIVRIAEEVFST